MKILVSPISKEIQNKIIVKYHFKPIKMAKIRKKNLMHMKAQGLEIKIHC